MDNLMSADKDTANIPFERLTPGDLQLVYACADRAFLLVNHYLKQNGNTRDTLLERDKLMLIMDIACARLSRDLDLFAFLTCDDLAFFGEFVTIQKTVDRSCGKIPAHVGLRFASTGANVATLTH